MKFTTELATNVYDLIEYLALGLRSIDLHENTISFIKEDLKIAAGSTVKIANPLNKLTPKKYLVVSQEGAGQITKAKGKKWTNDNVYLTNNGSEQVIATIIFMR